jgi:hypothetical protein
VAVALILAGVTAPAHAQEPPTLERFRAGYEARAMGNPYLLGLEDHVTFHVIPCESRGVLDPSGPHLGLAQFSPDTWAKARRAPEADYRDPWEQGWAVAAWLSMIEEPGGSGGWPHCWWS